MPCYVVYLEHVCIVLHRDVSCLKNVKSRLIRGKIDYLMCLRLIED